MQAPHLPKSCGYGNYKSSEGEKKMKIMLLGSKSSSYFSTNFSLIQSLSIGIRMYGTWFLPISSTAVYRRYFSAFLANRSFKRLLECIISVLKNAHLRIVCRICRHFKRIYVVCDAKQWKRMGSCTKCI